MISVLYPSLGPLHTADAWSLSLGMFPTVHALSRTLMLTNNEAEPIKELRYWNGWIPIVRTNALICTGLETHQVGDWRQDIFDEIEGLDKKIKIKIYIRKQKWSFGLLALSPSLFHCNTQRNMYARDGCVHLSSRSSKNRVHSLVLSARKTLNSLGRKEESTSVYWMAQILHRART